MSIGYTNQDFINGRDVPRTSTHGEHCKKCDIETSKHHHNLCDSCYRIELKG